MMQLNFLLQAKHTEDQQPGRNKYRVAHKGYNGDINWDQMTSLAVVIFNCIVCLCLCFGFDDFIVHKVHK